MSDTYTLSTGEVVNLDAGIRPATWRDYVAKGFAPRPDDPDSEAPKQRRRPRWRPETVITWNASRPGKGGRPRKDDAMSEYDHSKCMRARLVGSCGALATCMHDGQEIYTEWSHWRSPVLAVTPEREAELRAIVGPCV